MNQLLLLFLIFFKTGLFTVGGGMAMIPLVQQELVRRGLMSASETIDMVAISQMTPGPFAVNCATFVGMRLCGLLSAVVSTVGVALPSFILCLLVARFFFNFNTDPRVCSVLRGIKPVVLALILSGLISIFISSVMPAFSISAVDFPVLGISVLLSVIMIKTKFSPALLVLFAGIFGAVFLRS